MSDDDFAVSARHCELFGKNEELENLKIMTNRSELMSIRDNQKDSERNFRFATK